MNWVAEIINLLGQICLLLGVNILHKEFKKNNY